MLMMLLVLLVLMVLLLLLVVVVLVHMPIDRSRQWWGRARHCPRRLRLLLRRVAARWGAQAEVLRVGKGGQLRGVTCCGQHLLLLMLMPQQKKMWR